MDQDQSWMVLRHQSGETWDLVSFVKSCAISHGILIEGQEVGSIKMPCMTLLPSPVKRKHFQLARDVQPAYNLLYHRVANDADFLDETFSQIKHSDDFIKRLMDIHDRVRKESGPPRICFEINRSDYMAESDTCSSATIKQVEINTIACGMGTFAPFVQNCHRSALLKLGREDLVENLPSNGSAVDLAENMSMAWKLYGSKESVILFVLQPAEHNIYGIRRLALDIQKLHSNIRVKMLTFIEIYERAKLTNDLRLIVDDTEVAVVYYRTGYSPNNYPTEKEWEARTLLERSTAIKCPSVQYQLAGFKKVQQVLCGSGAVEKYLKDPAAISQLRETFTAQYSFEGKDGDYAIRLALKNPEKYVLKPQREGGGSNYFDEEISKVLAEVENTAERNNYILMERIIPREHHGFLMSHDQPLVSGNMVGELGIFGCLISVDDKIIKNEAFGHAMRTKRADENEGGIFAAFAGIDSPYLIN